jgi:hypothetical protein
MQLITRVTLLDEATLGVRTLYAEISFRSTSTITNKHD